MSSDEFAILTGTRAWSADPTDYASIVHLRFQPDRRCRLVFGYGQTVYADIHSEFQIPEAGLIRLRFLPSPHKLAPAFDYRPEHILESAEIGFRITEQEYSGTRRVVPRSFRYLRRLSFARSPFPPRPWFPFSPPSEFVGYDI